LPHAEETPALVLYEYPFNEGIRTMLRLESLFDRLGQLVPRDTPVDHHFALATVFEIIEVASRADLKSDVLKELERHRAQFQGWRGNPAISEAALDDIVGRIEGAVTGLNERPGKAGQALMANEWLMSLRSRIGIPGGTCEFDLPGYHAWQQHPPGRRRADLTRWTASLLPLAQALQLVLSLIRESGTAQRVVAAGGNFQQTLPAGKVYHLLRARIDDDELVPEITGHRLIVSVRLMRADTEGRLRPAGGDPHFELTVCA
jgi:cell division protein ZapD